MRLAITALLSLICILAAQAEDLTTRDGTVYRNYRVVSSDPGYVTILYNDGGARVPLAELPADLQREYHYDPATATAYTRQFEAEDHHERVAVQVSQSALPMPVAPDSTLSPVATSSPNAPASSDSPAASAPVASTSSDTASAGSNNLDLGGDPLSQDADVLSQDSLAGDAGSSSQTDDYSYYAAYDNSGGLWVSSYDVGGNRHWYRWDRKGGDRQGKMVRLDGGRDLPPNALVTLDRSGQWVITYLDDHGVAQRFYRSPSELHADPGAGAWRVVVDDNGNRSLRHEGEVPNPPQNFHHYAYVDQGPAHENRASTFHGFAGARPGIGYPGTSYSGSIVMGSNVHTGLGSGQMGNGMSPPRSYSGSSGGSVSGTSGSTTVIRVTAAPTPGPATTVRTH